MSSGYTCIETIVVTCFNVDSMSVRKHEMFSKIIFIYFLFNSTHQKSHLHPIKVKNDRYEIGRDRHRGMDRDILVELTYLNKIVWKARKYMYMCVCEGV